MESYEKNSSLLSSSKSLYLSYSNVDFLSFVKSESFRQIVSSIFFSNKPIRYYISSIGMSKLTVEVILIS